MATNFLIVVFLALYSLKPNYMTVLFCAGAAVTGVQGTTTAYVADCNPSAIRSTAGWAYAAGRLGGGFWTHGRGA